MGTRSFRDMLLAGVLAAGLALPAVGAAQTTAPGDAGLVARGKYLATMGDCTGCHTAAGGQEFAGGQYMGMPFGKISTPNITPDKATGIGNYTDKQWVRVFRDGVNAKGAHLFPAMPYAFMSQIRTEDLLAMKAYFFSLAPVHAPRKPNKIYFPFSIARPAIWGWRLAFVPDHVFKPDPKLDAQQNRGAYIVSSFEHCAMCHSNRAMLGNSSVALPFVGGPITRWYTPNLTMDKATGIGSYSADDLYQFLKTGYSPALGSVSGPMSEVIDLSLKHLTDSDVHAIVAYLQTLKPVPAYTPRRAVADPAQMPGAAVYADHCASCHQVDGRGLPGLVPALDRNGMAIATGPQSLIRVIIGGHEARGPYAMMPGVGASMTDQQVADVANYVRQAWSNHAPTNAGLAIVAWIRADTHTLTNGMRPGGCPRLVQPELAKLVGDPASGVPQLLQGITLPTLLPSVDSLISKVRAAAPQLAKNDIVNGLTIAYCPIVARDAAIPTAQKPWRLINFGERVYTQLNTNGQY